MRKLDVMIGIIVALLLAVALASPVAASADVPDSADVADAGDVASDSVDPTAPAEEPEDPSAPSTEEPEDPTAPAEEPEDPSAPSTEEPEDPTAPTDPSVPSEPGVEVDVNLDEMTITIFLPFSSSEQQIITPDGSAVTVSINKPGAGEVASDPVDPSVPAEEPDVEVDVDIDGMTMTTCLDSSSPEQQIITPNGRAVTVSIHNRR